MSAESDAFRAAMADDPRDLAGHAVLITNIPACECGCGRPKGVSVAIPDVSIFLPDAAKLDALIDLLAAARERAWGARPGRGDGG